VSGYSLSIRRNEALGISVRSIVRSAEARTNAEDVAGATAARAR
jgi:hypothetical protein